MNSYIITLNNSASKSAANRCISTSNLNIQKIEASTPDTLGDLPAKWTYPWEPHEERHEAGMKLTAYKTNVKDKRIACFISHYRLWKQCVELNQDIMILEHDAEFVREFDYQQVKQKFTGDILGLNDPRNATRKANVFHQKLKQQYKGKEIIVNAPWIDDKQIPQGLAGNSAYIIKPAGAQKLLDLVKKYGMWPNDAIMCKQLMPGSLQCVYPYYTRVQRIKSTTTK